jgi:predicted ester cyclase
MDRKQVLHTVLKFGFVLAEQNCKAFFHDINMVYEGRTTDSRALLACTDTVHFTNLASGGGGVNFSVRLFLSLLTIMK